MTVAEKIAYLKGLCEGLGLEQDKKETKVINAIIDTLDEISLTLEDLRDTDTALGDEIDEISEDLSEIEEFLFEDEDDDDDDEMLFQVKCPSCGDEITIDNDVLEEGSISCPGCGEELEFDLSGLFDGDCGCGCGCDVNHDDE